MTSSTPDTDTAYVALNDEQINREHHNNNTLRRDVEIDAADNVITNANTNNEHTSNTIKTNITQVMIIAASLYTLSFSLNVIFPMAPFIVMFHDRDIDEADIGYFAGYLGAAYSVGTLISAVPFGIIADRYGRRSPMMAGLVGTAVMMTLFAFAPSYVLAVLARFGAGLVSGVNGVSKTIMSELCSQKDMPRCFGLFGAMDGLGRTTAPSIGGFLQRTDYTREESQSFLDRYPFAIPSLISAGLAAVAAILAFYRLEESMKKTASTPVISTSTSRSASVYALISNRPIMLACSINGLLAFLHSMITEVMPLWLITSPRLGGFGFNGADIGIVLTILGPIQIIHQIFIMPKYAKLLGFKRLCVVTLSIMTCMCILLPAVYYIAGENGNTTVIWTGIVVTFVPLVLSRSVAFTCVFAFIANSSDTKVRASVNAIAQLLVALANIIGPIVAGNLYSISITSGAPWPFNYALVFHLTAFTALIAIAVVSSFDDRIDQKYETGIGSTRRLISLQRDERGEDENIEDNHHMSNKQTNTNDIEMTSPTNTIRYTTTSLLQTITTNN